MAIILAEGSGDEELRDARNKEKEKKQTTSKHTTKKYRREAINGAIRTCVALSS